MNNFFNRNLTAKIISILFALVMWTYVMSEINPKISRVFVDVPIQLLNLDAIKKEGLVVVNGGDNTIRVTLWGRRDEVYRIAKGDIKATIDLMGYRVGANNIPVEINGFPNIDVEFSPKTVRIDLEEIVRRQKDVSLMISGSPKVGYILNEAQYKPTVVWIEGPESYVSAVDRIIARLEVNDESENIVASLPLKAINQRGAEVTNVDIKTSYIDVYLPIDRLRTVKIEPTIRATAAPGYVITNIDIQPEQLAFLGQEETIINITSIETEALIFENLTETINQEIKLNLPEGITQFNEEKVILLIEVKPTAEKTILTTRSNITFTGLEPGYRVEEGSIPEIIEVQVTTAVGYMDTLDQSDIQLIVDLAALKEGQHEVVPDININGIPTEHIKSININPSSLSIRILRENQ